MRTLSGARQPVMSGSQKVPPEWWGSGYGQPECLTKGPRVDGLAATYVGGETVQYRAACGSAIRDADGYPAVLPRFPPSGVRRREVNRSF